MTREQRRIVTVRSHAENHQIDYRFRTKLTDEFGPIIAGGGVQQCIIRGIGGGANGIVGAVGIGHNIGDLVGGTNVGRHLMDI